MCIVRQSVIKELCMRLSNSKTNVRSKCLYCYLSNHLNNDQNYNSAMKPFLCDQVIISEVITLVFIISYLIKCNFLSSAMVRN